MLKEDNIQLRAIEPSDLEVLYLWENDEDSWLVSQTIVPFSKHLLQQFIDTAHLDIYTNKQLRLMIDYTDDGVTKTIGCIDLFNFDVKNKRAGVGILIGDYSARQKGLAAKALTLFINYSFMQLGLHQLYCNIMPMNTASMNLFTKQGFEIIGRKKDWIFDKDQWHDECMLQLIRK